MGPVLFQYRYEDEVELIDEEALLMEAFWGRRSLNNESNNKVADA